LLITNSTIVPWNPPEPYNPDVDNGNLNVTAYIKSISITGEMEILFNASMLTTFNYTLLNETNFDIYVIPAKGREDFDDFNLSDVNLTWSLVNYTDNLMRI